MLALVDESEARYRAPALDKGLDILELLSETEEGRSQAEIAKALERSPNEIYRMLDRLVRRGYLVRTESDRYELTLKLFSLAHRHTPMRRLVSQAMPVMRRFARDAGQSCHVTVYDRGEVVVVAQAESPSYWGLAIRVGAHVGLFNTGSGHVLLAFAGDDQRALMMEEHELLPGETIPGALDARLAVIRDRGYEVMESAQTISVTNLAVPILGPNGEAVAALTCPFMQPLDTAAPDLERALERLIAAGAAITQNASGTAQRRDPGQEADA
jgi:DNA-binding IclR family transcriptional regulator